MFQSKSANYVFSELQFIGASNQDRVGEPVILLHLELQEGKPTERKHIQMDQAYQLRDDLNKLLAQFETLGE